MISVVYSGDTDTTKEKIIDKVKVGRLSVLLRPASSPSAGKVRH